ncbi:MAG: radical SAM family heme chaperone HemW [Acidiferrobacteraceae bacterium]
MLEPETIPCALYIHLPWCVRKCPYCDFNSYEGTAPSEQHYVDALLEDLDTELVEAPIRPLHSIFFGGGTPSLFSADAIGMILNGVRARVALEPGCEITLEANPGASDAERFQGYRAAGVNRLSIGVQSFNDGNLRALGRIHDAQCALRAAESARTAGFDNLNLDLMYGLPGQDPNGLAQDLARAIEIAPEHLSLYQLTIEEGTPFAHRPPTRPGEGEIEAMEALLVPVVSAAGYRRYEVSAYARADRACRHNLNYWNFGDYIGIGAGAHGKISRADGIWRHRKPGQPQAYLHARGQAITRTRLLPDDILFEFMLNATRLVDGFPLSLFERRTGQPGARLAQALRPALARGLAAIDGGRVRPTTLGSRFLNDLQALFLPAATCARVH